ncbi:MULTISPECIES: class I SAM-dependent methyltransferase [unclassified Sphingomonas]|uniref:class I SAM-dependent methyltransferase n=1 Tax=unclassified Sphingomonas TaxID=196159 RepID=UPI0006F39846|nr:MULTISPECIES: class I SAM-dependent methyltransferase [unclassified Sphingomonas]KQX22740.1 methyltransferase type 12 [Sphingomonas sp. Root1294]KQY67782.1 methyltransferase type 12 [Sphingomonas sp. Root50]KRB88704.1 methyltransferase type 12 [Sphingomonas sp. Root720]
MSVSREEVVWAYRMLLGREPESEAVIALQMTAPNRDQLRQAFLGSAEFNRQMDGRHGLPHVGRFFDIDRTDIDITCSDEQLQAMFDRIGQAWKLFGETEPHWSVLTSDAFRQENLAAHIDAFYSSGRNDIDLHLHFLRRAGLPVRLGKALDFGCGVGRLTLALAAHADQVVGVDISPPHLRLAIERAQQTATANISFESIAAPDDLDRYRDFDLVISLIVLQHNPPPVMASLYRKLLRALAPGGVAIVQMPTFMQGQSFTAAHYLANEQPSMEMNALPQKLIFEIIEEMGCRPLEIRENGVAGEPGLSHVIAAQRVL